MRLFFVIAGLYTMSLSVYADELPLINGRYVESEALVLKLTDEQKAFIDHFRKCHVENFKSMNAYTPYVFSLTESQAGALRKRKGYSPRWFEVYETYRGFNETAPHWNLVLRFSDDEIEIPLKLVISDNAAKDAHDTQGWKVPNPCAQPLTKLGQD